MRTRDLSRRGLYAAGGFFALTVLKRVCRVLWASAVSDVLYQSSAWPAVLEWAAAVLEIAATGVAVGLVAVLTASRGGRSGAAAVASFLGVLLLDGVAAFLVDLWQRNIAGVEEYAALNLLFQMIEPAAVAAAALLVSLLLRRTKLTRRRQSVVSLLAVSGLYAAVRLTVVGVNIADFFSKYRYPTAAEIASMITDGVSALLLPGVLLSGVAYLAAALLCRHLSEDL